MPTPIKTRLRIERHRLDMKRKGFRVAQVTIHQDDLDKLLDYARRLRDARREEEVFG